MTKEELFRAFFLKIYIFKKDFWDVFIESIDGDQITVSNIHDNERNTYTWWENQSGQIIINSDKWFCIIISNEESLQFIDLMDRHYTKSAVDAKKRAERIILDSENRAKAFSELKQRVIEKTGLKPVEPVV